jgi:hypothetical protein
MDQKDRSKQFMKTKVLITDGLGTSKVYTTIIVIAEHQMVLVLTPSSTITR